MSGVIEEQLTQSRESIETSCHSLTVGILQLLLNYKKCIKYVLKNPGFIDKIIKKI